MKKISAHKFEEFLIALSIFISSIVFFKAPFEGYFHYLIFILFIPFFIIRYGLPTSVLKLLALPFLFSLFYVLLGENTLFNFIKIAVGLLLSCSFYYYVFVHYDFSTLKLFRLYLKGAVVISIIGLIQAVSYTIKIKFGYDYSWLFNKWGIIPGGIIGIRINSIFSEPSQFAILISPAVFVAMQQFITKKFTFISKKYCFIIFAALILSASSTGYFGVFLSLVLIALNFGKILDAIVIGVVIYLAYFFMYNNVHEFRTRIDAYFNIVNEDELTMDDINSSSFVQYNNFHVATTSFMKNPLVGTGLGSYPLAYDKYSLTREKDFFIKKGFDFNSQDANSLFLRAMTETGIVGIAFLLILVFKCFIFKTHYSADSVSWVISSSILIIILLYFFRQGNYFINGFPFFMWLYYYNFQNHKNYLIKIGK